MHLEQDNDSLRRQLSVSRAKVEQLNAQLDEAHYQSDQLRMELSRVRVFQSHAPVTLASTEPVSKPSVLQSAQPPKQNEALVLKVNRSPEYVAAPTRPQALDIISAVRSRLEAADSEMVVLVCFASRC
jgi:hypothetical protein